MAEPKENLQMEKIVSLCKRRGFIFQSSEIYGGINGFWDYGPLGCELKRNIRDAWWRDIVHRRENVVGLDSSIIMHPKVWEASGHVHNFFDLKSDCKNCKKRFKSVDLKDNTKCPECSGELTEARPFNLMFKTHQGPIEDSENELYLRPETAQGIFVDFKNLFKIYGLKLPAAIAQVGKAYRNEISPRQGVIRLEGDKNLFSRLDRYFPPPSV